MLGNERYMLDIERCVLGSGEMSGAGSEVRRGSGQRPGFISSLSRAQGKRYILGHLPSPQERLIWGPTTNLSKSPMELITSALYQGYGSHLPGGLSDFPWEGTVVTH